MKYGWSQVEETAKLLPEWTSIYFVKVKDQGMKCNLCENILNVDGKSSGLLEHMKTEHKDVYFLHKDNPDATVGFRIEFLNLNTMKDTEHKIENVILEEVCEDTTDSEAQQQLLEEAAAKAQEAQDMHESTLPQYLFLEECKEKKKPKLQKRDSTKAPRKRSWVWKYFDKLSNIIYRCKLCSVVLSIKGCNSNNMNRHVKSRHPTVYRNELMKTKPQMPVFIPGEEVDTPYAIKTEEIYASDRSMDVEEVESSSQKLRRSWIWSYFERVSATHAQCKLCKRHICHGGNATGNMNRHLKMIHHKTAFDSNWVWKVFENTEEEWYSCKICDFRCHKYEDLDKSLSCILLHLKAEHGVVSGDQIITSTDINEN